MLFVRVLRMRMEARPLERRQWVNPAVKRANIKEVTRHGGYWPPPPHDPCNKPWWKRPDWCS